MASVAGTHPGWNGGSVVPEARVSLTVLKGRITAYNAAPVWRKAIETLTRQPGVPVAVDASRLEYIDDVGIALLFDLARRQRSRGADVRINGLAPRFASLIEVYDPEDLAQAPKGMRRIATFEHLGRATAEQMEHASRPAGFARQCFPALGRAGL